jgi:serine/threonine protein phosphatase PrpC
MVPATQVPNVDIRLSPTAESVTTSPLPANSQPPSQQSTQTDDNPTGVYAAENPQTLRYVLRAEAYGVTDVGPSRAENQDAIVISTAVGTESGTRLQCSSEIPLSGIQVAVIDGMGGYAGGRDAAALVAIALARTKLTLPGAECDAWFEGLSRDVASAGQAWNTPDMGATAAVLTVTPSEFFVSNVGDCRVYQVVNGRLGQLSVDDRTGNQASSAVTQAIGPSARIGAHTLIKATAGQRERFILCSDGVWSTLGQEEMRMICTKDIRPAQIAEKVIKAAYVYEAKDNCSIIVLDLWLEPQDSTIGSDGAHSSNTVEVITGQRL